MTIKLAENSSEKIRIVAIVFSLLLLILPVSILAPPSILIDMPAFYAAISLIKEGSASKLYDPSMIFSLENIFYPEKTNVIFYNFPAGILWLLPFIYFPKENFQIYWWILLICAVVLSIFLLKKIFFLSQVIFVRLSAFTCLFAPYWESIKHGQLAPLLLLSLCLTCVLLRLESNFFAAFFLSLFLLKPQYLPPMLAFLLGAKKYKFIVYFFILCFLFTLLSLQITGQEAWLAYFKLIASNVQNRKYMSPEFGPTLRGELLLSFPNFDSQVNFIALIANIFISVISFFLGKKFSKSEFWLEFWLICSIPASILFSFHSHNYDLLLLLPVFVAILRLKSFSKHKPGVDSTQLDYFKVAANTNIKTNDLKLYKLILLAKYSLYILLILFLLPVYAKVHYDVLLHGLNWNPFFIAFLLFYTTLLGIMVLL